MHSLKSYITGFILSLAFTLVAYFSVVNHAPNAFWIIFGMATLQFTAQTIFFLHLGQGKDGRWNLLSFGLAFGAMFILVFGSLWIMQNLNYHMTPGQMEEYIVHDEGFKK